MTDDNTLSIDELVEILEQSNCHRDAIRYAKRAEERGGTAILGQLKYSLKYVTVEKCASRGTHVEETLLRKGAEAALENTNLDTTNTEICESIVEDYHR